MELLCEIFAGLGLFFIGVNVFESHIRQITGRRFRAWMARATGHPLSSALVGTLAGVLTQSTNAVTSIVASMVTTGIVERQSATIILGWANVGTSVLVFLATLDTHITALYILGIVGFSQILGPRNKDSYPHLFGILFGIGALFLGLWLIPLGAEPLKELDGVQSFIRFSQYSLAIPFLIGVTITFLDESSAILSTLAVALSSTGLLTLDQALMIVLGSNLGAGCNEYFLSWGLNTTGLQLALVQLLAKLVGTLFLSPVLLMEIHWGTPGLNHLTSLLTDDPSYKIAIAYFIPQMVSALLATGFKRPFESLALRYCPSNPVDALSKPHYLYQQAIEEAESALDLVEKEQARLISLLPHYLDELRGEEVEGTPYDSQELHEACTTVAGECTLFLEQLMEYPQSHETLERIMNIRSRNESLIHLQEGCLSLTRMLRADFAEPAARSLRQGLAEGFCTVLTIMSDSLSETQCDFELLLALTSDRASMMESMRSRLVESESGLSVESQTRLLPATSLFERLIWLVNHYAALLDRQAQKIQLEAI